MTGMGGQYHRNMQVNTLSGPASPRLSIQQQISTPVRPKPAWQWT